MVAIARLIENPIEASTFSLEDLVASRRNKPPSVAAMPSVLNSRRRFLRDSGAPDAEDTFERIIAGDELQPVSYLERGMIAARSVARVALGGRAGFGTGFLIAPRVLITNNHVLPDISSAQGATAEFRYELDLGDNPIAPIVFRLDPTALFHTSVPLDFTVVAVSALSDRGARLVDFGMLPLLDVTGKAAEGEWLTIVQHPNGDRKQICVRENQLLKRGADVLWYSTDTMPGSSGSPVFNNDWYVVALHHSGVPATRNGETETNPDGTTKWIANEGIRASRIAQTLKRDLPAHPLLAPLFSATPASARVTSPNSATTTPSRPARETATMFEQRFPLDIRLRIGADGQVVVQPAGTASGSEGFAAATSLEKRTAGFDAPFDDDYSTREGSIRPSSARTDIVSIFRSSAPGWRRWPRHSSSHSRATCSTTTISASSCMRSAGLRSTALRTSRLAGAST